LKYTGTELEFFASAVNWKMYIGRQLSPYIFGDVLDVGAGIGATTPFLYNGRVRSWTCLEPDTKLAKNLEDRRKPLGGSIVPRITTGVLPNLGQDYHFDSILYIDVLEHIEDDRGELQQAAAYLNPNGTLVVLAPAHAMLFSEFDRALGHYRRYSLSTLRRISPIGVQAEKSFYMDSLGFLVSLSNWWILHQAAPTQHQILLWDRMIVPLSRITDRLTARRTGKSVVTVWRKFGAE